MLCRGVTTFPTLSEKKENPPQPGWTAAVLLRRLLISFFNSPSTLCLILRTSESWPLTSFSVSFSETFLLETKTFTKYTLNYHSYLKLSPKLLFSATALPGIWWTVLRTEFRHWIWFTDLGCLLCNKRATVWHNVGLRLISSSCLEPPNPFLEGF